MIDAVARRRIFDTPANGQRSAFDAGIERRPHAIRGKSIRDGDAENAMPDIGLYPPGRVFRRVNRSGVAQAKMEKSAGVGGDAGHGPRRLSAQMLGGEHDLQRHRPHGKNPPAK